MRLGFIFGFLLGAGVASVLSRRERREESFEAMDKLRSETASAVEEVEDSGEGVVDQLKHRLDEAKTAAREEAQEKEAELTRRFEETIRPEKSES
jgi:F0F1-type ATP synthase membrane subunit b/b'